jgi:hypothetical protein
MAFDHTRHEHEEHVAASARLAYGPHTWLITMRIDHNNRISLEGALDFRLR